MRLPMGVVRAVGAGERWPPGTVGPSSATVRSGLGVVGVGYDESGLVGGHDGLGAVAQAELAQHAADVCLDGFLGDHEPGRDFRIGQALGDQS